MVEEIKGDITETGCGIIAHGVNCQGVMGAGVAKALYEKWPVIKEVYLDDHNSNVGLYPDEYLGDIQPVLVEKSPEKFVINCYTQQNYGSDKKQVYLSYKALEECLEKVRKFAYMEGINGIAMPKIGCGLAGGDWSEVRETIKSVFNGEPNIKIYVYTL